MTAPLAAAQQEHRILSELQATYAHSTPGPAISDRAGRYVFVAEAGVLAVMDATSGQTGFTDPDKDGVSISSQGVRAVELLLDPDAELASDPDGDESLLYVAGGRLGLWAMRADPRAGQPMPATRIDDGAYPSGGGNTWCNSLEIVTVDGTRYLAALLAHEGCSRLRLYELAEVRARMDSTLYTFAETGNEVPPAADIGVGGNCGWQTPRYGSFGYGMAVDGSTVYVAMGRYGLVKVAFASNLTATVTAGPYFGSGSHYHHTYGGGYDDFEFRQQDPEDDQAFIVTRQEPPQFVDVAVQADGTRHLLWCAVDNLGLVGFDLSGAWSTTMPIAHQEGSWVASSGKNDTRIVLVDDPDTTAERTYAHRLAMTSVEGGEDTELILAVAANTRPLILSDAILDEGRTLGHLGVGYQGTGWPSGNTTSTLQMTLHELMEVEEQSLLAGTEVYEYTVIYELDGLSLNPPASATIQHAKFLRQGSRHVFLPADQPEDELILVGGHLHAKPGTPPSRTFRARYDWPFQGAASLQPTGSDFLVREMEDRPGWHSYDISYSPSPDSGDTLYLGSTDGGCVAASLMMAYCGTGFVPFLAATDGIGRGTFGILFDTLAVWPDDTVGQGDPARDFVFGAGRPVVDGVRLKPHWMLAHMDPGEEVCDDTETAHRPPDRLKEVYVESPLDNFQRGGRGFYNACGAVDPAYDAHLGMKAAWVGRSATPAGIYLLDRTELEALTLDDTETDDGDILKRPDTPDVFKRELLTHPEFAGPYYETDTTLQNDIEGFLFKHGLNGQILTLYPALARIPSPTGSSDPEHWVLNVPCAAVHLPELHVFAQRPTWTPEDVYREPDTQNPDRYFDHAMVRVFDVHDSTLVLTDEDENLPVYTLLAPRPQTAAVRLKVLTWEIDSVERHFLLVTDFTNSLMAWEITDLLDREELIVAPHHADYDDYFLGEWITPLSISDGESNNVWNLEVVREEWTDGQQVERDEVYIYAAVARYGVAVLRFLPDATTGPRLQQVGHLRTPSGMGGLRIREIGGQRTLLITENNAGLRAYGYPHGGGN